MTSRSNPGRIYRYDTHPRPRKHGAAHLALESAIANSRSHNPRSLRTSPGPLWLGCGSEASVVVWCGRWDDSSWRRWRSGVYRRSSRIWRPWPPQLLRLPLPPSPG